MRLLLLLFALCTCSVQAEQVHITNGEWPPYLGEKLPHHGIASRIVAEAFALEGVEVRWEFHPWARSMRMAERGQRDGTAVWLYSPERAQTFYISEPVVESNYHLFHRKGRIFDWRTVDELKGQRICATLDYNYGEAFQQAEADGLLEVRRMTSDELCFRQLLAGRADLFPMDKVVAFAMLYEHFSAAERAQLSFHHMPLRSDPLHLMLSREVPENAERIRRFNRGLAALRESGKVAQYLLEIQEPVSLAP